MIYIAQHRVLELRNPGRNNVEIESCNHDFGRRCSVCIDRRAVANGHDTASAVLSRICCAGWWRTIPQVSTNISTYSGRLVAGRNARPTNVDHLHRDVSCYWCWRLLFYAQLIFAASYEQKPTMRQRVWRAINPHFMQLGRNSACNCCGSENTPRHATLPPMNGNLRVLELL